jgi:hypothetical protein
MHERTTIVGTFADHDHAEDAIDRLRTSGIERDHIGIAGNDPDGVRTTQLVEEHGNASGPGAVGGLITGAAAGGVFGWLGLAAIPAVGPFLAGGAIGAALIGAAAGGATGGILGGLLGLGIPRHEAEMHEEQVRQGRTIVSVQADASNDVEAILRDAGAEDVRAYSIEAEPVTVGDRQPR